MSEVKPKWQRGLFWASILAGVLALTLILGYFVGRKVYGTELGMQRPGAELWWNLYERALFLEVDNMGYRYSDLDKDFTMDLRLVEFYPHQEGATWGLSVFEKPDGSELEDLLSWEEHYAILPVVGRVYRVTWCPIFYHEPDPFAAVDSPIDMKVIDLVLDVEDIPWE